MKIKSGFMVSTVAGSHIVVPTGEKTVDFNGIMTLNETGLFLWERLSQGADADTLLQALTAEYDVDVDTAAADIAIFLGKLEAADLVE